MWNMKRIVTIVMMVLGVACGMQAQDRAEGDLNKDGINDVAEIVKPEGGRPVLNIYFGTADGQQKLWKSYKEVIPVPEIETQMIDVSMTITEKGVLRFEVSSFMSMGGYGNNNSNFSYRYQNGDFFLIGKETQNMSRNTGNLEIVSENYLTWKRQVVKDNVFAEGDVPKQEKWTRLKKRPLEKLGARVLE